MHFIQFIIHGHKAFSIVFGKQISLNSICAFARVINNAESDYIYGLENLPQITIKLSEYIFSIIMISCKAIIFVSSSDNVRYYCIIH